MGDVWKARDTRVNRSVAIKVARQEFTDRFRREANAIAALNHPHVCALYDVGPNYLVMELCEGKTLAARLKGGKLPLADVLKFGAYIAGAAAEAHAKGLVHRDLKPANIMLTKNGVKVLDFGLAKSAGDEIVTRANVVVGTPAYMAPEQRRGMDAGPRTDIYALGLVLSEMATGTRGSLDGLTGAFAHIIRRCVAEDPDDRWQSAADIKAQLEWLQGQSSADAVPARRTMWVRVAVVVLAAGLGAVASRFLRPSSPSPGLVPPVRFDLSLDFEPDGFSYVPEPSPDGRFFVYLSQPAREKSVLRVRALGDAESRTLAGTENARTFFWSADSKWIGFVVDDKVKKISPAGGAVQTLATVAGAIQQPTWGSRGDILYRTSNREPLTHITESGGAPEVVTRLDKSRTENSHRGQQFLPDGRRFLFTARCGDRSMNALYLGSLDTKTTKRLMPIDSQARFIARGPDEGVVVYERDGALVARQLDLTREEMQGEPFVVLDHVGYVPSGLLVSFSASADGRVAVTKGVSSQLANVEWYSRTGERLGTLGEPGQWAQVRISPDGTRVVVTGIDPQNGNRDVFAMDMRGVLIRLTTDGANDWYPVWSPDGKRIVFMSDRPKGGVFLKLAASAAAAEDPFGGGDEPEDWSRDGRWLVGASAKGAWISEAKPGATPIVLRLAARGRADGLAIAPDGRWIAYVSNESGMPEVYVRGFQGPGVSPDAVQVSRGGGNFPVWNAAGGELLFASADSSIWSFNTKGLASGAVPDPVRLFRPCPSSTFPFSPSKEATFMRAFDTRDGARFAVTCTVEPPGRFSVLLNWPFASPTPAKP